MDTSPAGRLAWVLLSQTRWNLKTSSRGKACVCEVIWPLKTSLWPGVDPGILISKMVSVAAQPGRLSFLHRTSIHNTCPLSASSLYPYSVPAPNLYPDLLFDPNLYACTSSRPNSSSYLPPDPYFCLCSLLCTPVRHLTVIHTPA